MKYFAFTFLIILLGCSRFSTNAKRIPASVKNKDCYNKPSLCSFHVIGHRGAPRLEAENTIASYEKALEIGANALEIDITISKDKHLLIFHDRNPNSLLGILRSIGIEGFKYVPAFPAPDSPFHKKADELTLAEIKEHWGYSLKVGGLKDPTKEIPSLLEFANWAKQTEKLEAIYIDFKIEEDQLEELDWIAQSIEDLFKDAHFDTLVMVPRAKIYSQLQHWAKKNTASFKVLYDFEKHGVLKKHKITKFTSVSLGHTIYTKWKTYLAELTEILSKKNDDEFIYPVVAWTIDDPLKMYELIQKGVDGIVTNDPDLLYQLKHHHYKDHAKIVHLIHRCLQENPAQTWTYCGSGHDIGPLKSIQFNEVKNWLCPNPYYDKEIKSLFGCGLTSKDIHFHVALENSEQIQFWTGPNKQMHLLRLPEETNINDYILLSAEEKLCNDGLFNYSCEYKLAIEWQDQSHYAIKRQDYAEDFDGQILALTPIDPNAKFVKFIIHEVDDKKIKDTYEQVFPTDQLLNGNLYYPLIMESKDDTFQLWSSVQKLNRPSKPEIEMKKYAINFKTITCKDGFLNAKCEYGLRIGYLDPNGKLIYKFTQYNKNEFTSFIEIPSTVKSIYLDVAERDNGKDINSSRIKKEFALFHSSHQVIVAPDETFSALVKILDYDYDHNLFDDQGFSKTKSIR